MSESAVEKNAAFVSHRRVVFWMLALYTFPFAWLDYLYYESEQWEATSIFLSALIFLVLVLFWCQYDARVRGGTGLGGLGVLIALIPLLGLPVYSVQTRGWLGALKFGFGIPLFAIGMFTYWATWYLLVLLFP